MDMVSVLTDVRALVAWAAAVFLAASARAGGFVTYEEFGAAGDGKTDDQKAIVAAHAAANKRGLPVKAGNGKTYYIGKGAKVAVIKTNVDFGTARFIIDDRAVDDFRAPVFRIEPSAGPYAVKGVKTLARGQKNIGAELRGPCLLEAENSNAKHFIRYGLNRTDGEPQREVFLAAADGTVDPLTPIAWDFPKVTRLTARPIDRKTLVVRGGIFTTVANCAEPKFNYFSRRIEVCRSNVRIEGLKHYVTGEGDRGAPYYGFVFVTRCANVTVANCLFTPHKIYRTIGSAGESVGMGTYDIAANNSVNVTLAGCRQTRDIDDSRYWGIFTSNYCKNLLFDGCELSRFDAHKGVANATIRNSTLGHQGINAVGSGTFRVENTTVKANYFFKLRDDYGSTWSGDLIVRNCRFVPGNGAPVEGVLVFGRSTDWHDFGYPCEMPRRIVFDGLEINDSRHPRRYSGPLVFSAFNEKNNGPGYAAKYPYKVTETVYMRKVKTASGKKPVLSKNRHMFRNVKVVKIPGYRKAAF